MVKNETKFWHEVKKNTPQISWTRIENTSLLGTPDLLGYNTNSHFFTVELKVTKGKKVKFSPHQIAFHVKHPNNTFILTKHLASRDVKLYEGKVIEQLVACGLSLEACCLGLEACCLKLESVGGLDLSSSFYLAACRLRLDAFFFQLASLYDILDGGKYGSYLIYSFINFLCLAPPYFRSGSVLIFFKISFCLVFTIRYIFYFFIPAISTIIAFTILKRGRTGRVSCNYS